MVTDTGFPPAAAGGDEPQQHPPGEAFPALGPAPEAIIRAVLGRDRRVLLVGRPGVGKSTLIDQLARALGHAGRSCRCIGADPGSPRFGLPGAVCLGRWDGGTWVLEAAEALCSLDAGRFRLPLVAAVGRLAAKLAPGTVLVDGPGVVRGVAGSELLLGITESARIDLVVAVNRQGLALPLAGELQALPAQVAVVRAAPAARRPGRRARARARTRLWDAFLAGPVTHPVPVASLRLLGTPPPADVPAAWAGRQVAFMDGRRTVAMGEAVRLEDGCLRVRLPAGARMAGALLVRDARRGVDGFLATAPTFTPEPMEYVPAPACTTGHSPGPRVEGRVGSLSVCLVNGVFGDPLLHVRLRHRRRSLLFDLGEGSRLPARVAHQVTDVFISHTHIDHIAGFLWFLRSRIGDFPTCRIYGPPGLAQNIDGLLRGILWDRVGSRGPRFAVAELHGERLLRFAVQAGRPGCEPLGATAAADGTLLDEPAFRVRATTLSHASPVLAFALEPARQINIRKDRLAARGLPPGPWLGELKRHLHAGETDIPMALPNGQVETVTRLGADIALISPGRKLAYATDFADTPENRRRVVALARGAHTFFCEASFMQADADQAARTAHLTTRACGEIAEAAGVARLVPFHFSRRYEREPGPLYDEISEVSGRVVVPRCMALPE